MNHPVGSWTVHKQGIWYFWHVRTGDLTCVEGCTFTKRMAVRKALKCSARVVQGPTLVAFDDLAAVTGYIG